ncbi:MAG TPA: hypothetical protein VFW83_07375 [Bryobacteraceae bacterium]|nr:hypothetical protein [Bryobacteraceae bacterium]
MSIEYDPDGTVGEALHVYLKAYGLGDYNDAYQIIKLFGFVPAPLPNPPARKRALRRHDLNHVLGSYDAVGTSGELDIAGFEIGARGGCRDYWVAWGINLFFFGFGMLLRPKQLFRAFVRSRGARNAYSLPDVEGDFLNRRLAAVRAELKIPDRVPAPERADRWMFSFWACLSLLLVLGSGAVLVGLAMMLARLV